MIIVQNFDEFNKYLDIESGTEIIQNKLKKTNGWYKNLNKSICALYIKNSMLCIKLDNLEIKITDNLKPKIKQISKDFNEFQLLDEKDTIIFSFLYDSKIEFLGSPFEYLNDDEEFDWGLFLHNIISDTKRKSIFIENNNNNNN